MLWLFMTIISVFIDFRLNTAFCIKFYKLSKEENAKNLYVVILFNFLAAILVYLLWIAFPEIVSRFLQIPVSPHEINIICLIGLSSVTSKLFTSLLVVTKEPKKYFLFSIISTVVLIPACLVFLFVMHYGYHSYFYGHLAAFGALSIFGFFHIQKKIPADINKLWSFKNLKELMVLSLPLIPDAFLMMLLASAGRYFLNIYHGLTLVAVYSVGYMFASAFNTLILAPLGQAISPILYEKYAMAEDLGCRFLESLLKYYWVVLLTIILAGYTCFNEVFPLMVGKNYLEALNIILILMLGMVISGGASLLSLMIIVKEKTHLVFIITFFSVVVNIVASRLLIPSWALYGAAVAGLMGYLFQALLVTLFTLRMIRIDLNIWFLSKFLIAVVFATLGYILIAQLPVSVYYQVMLKMVVFSLYMVALNRLIGIKRLLGRLYRDNYPTVLKPL